MHKISLTLLFFILVSSCKNNLPEDQEKIFTDSVVKSKIQYVKDYEFLYKFGKVDSNSSFLSKSVKFDTKGNAVEILKFTRPDSLVHPVDSTNNIFDNKGRLIEATEINYYRSADLDKPFIKTTRRSKYRYELNRRIELITYMNGALENRTKYRYGANNKVSEYVSYNTQGKLESKTEYLYKDDQEVGTKDYNEQGVIVSRNEIIHTDKNHTQNKYYNQRDSVESILDLLLNDKGWAIEDEYKSGDYYSKSKIEYNDWGLKISETKYNRLGEPLIYTKSVVNHYK